MSHGHDSHGHDDHEEKKGPKLPHLEEHLEDKIEESFNKDLEKFKEHYTKDNLIDIKNMAGEAHDTAYESFKKKFEELANDHNEPLAERGKELSLKHQNELLISYLKPFAEKAHGAKGKAMFEAFDKIKFDGENSEQERHAYLDSIAEEFGLYSSRDDPNDPKTFYGAMKKALKENNDRHYSVVNDLSSKVKAMTLEHHKNEIFKSTLGKSKYQRKPGLAIKAMNELGKEIEGFNGYEIEHDEDGKSKFYKFNINDLKSVLTKMAEHKTYTVSEEENKEIGLKYKKAGDHGESHGDSHGGGGGHH